MELLPIILMLVVMYGLARIGNRVFERFGMPTGSSWTEYGEWESNEKEIREKLLLLSKSAQDSIKKANGQLRDGTAKLIQTRARQMGYAVQEIKKGEQTQLVLVRYE